MGGSYTLKLRRTGTDRCTGTRIPSALLATNRRISRTESFHGILLGTGMPTLYANRRIAYHWIGEIVYVCVSRGRETRDMGLDCLSKSIRRNNLGESDGIWVERDRG